MSWPIVTLGEVAVFINGDRGKNYPSKGSFVESGVAFINAGSLSLEHRVVDSELNFITQDKYDSLRSGKIERGDILFCLRGSLGKFAVIENDLKGAIASSLVIIRANDKITLSYLKHYLGSVLCAKEIDTFENGAAQPNLSATDLKSFKIPLPPLDEQKRIAAILDKADAIRQKRKQAIVLADEFQRSVFLDMFGSDLVRDSNRVNFGDVTVLDAKMVDPRQDEYLDLLHIGPDRIQKNTGKLLPALTAREEGLISKKFFFNNQYVLYSKIRPYLRKAAIPEFSALCSADMYPVKPIEGKATREFIWMLLLSDLFDNYVASLPDRANIPKLNKKELAAFEFSLPEFEKVKQFSQIVKQNRKGLHSMEVAASTAEINFNALSQKAFSGQL
ncbi:restriction endonuclease subunit S [Vibrio vulnificus]|uniref:restriction endonuclease subunit S n=1 Tax=Vibrio vulnificus TaxID=672 RepID=UPI00102A5618|nr:restriction endonuclease subunit S [Vibrio vulnificus]EGQ8090125.1 hypothetical protein [Vibrio vulnificus]EHH0744984.1 hypothetical protein [Vibrio vulnificus]RZR01576.1 hypothetical protein D8T25_13050 [Vibrio vulnificus]